jgi:hypothetical protein
MTLPEFSLIRLTTDRFVASEGVGRDAIGVILDAFETGYIVEFSRPDGTTIAWFSVKPEDIEPAPAAVGTVSHGSTTGS